MHALLRSKRVFVGKIPRNIRLLLTLSKHDLKITLIAIQPFNELR